MNEDFYRIAETLDWLNRERNFPHNTCGASRHAQMIGEALCAGQRMSAVHDEPEHGGSSILSTVAALYHARTLNAVLLQLHRFEGKTHFSTEVVRQCWDLLKAESDRLEQEWLARERELSKGEPEVDTDVVLRALTLLSEGTSRLDAIKAMRSEFGFRLKTAQGIVDRHLCGMSRGKKFCPQLKGHDGECTEAS